jgi:pyruvate, water dikinase
MDLFRFLRRENVCHLLVDPEGKAARKLSDFKKLLECNNEALEIIGRLEDLYYGGGMFTMSGVKEAASGLSETTSEYIFALKGLSGGRYAALDEALKRIDRRITASLEERGQEHDGPLTARLEEVSPDAFSLVGGKSANLAMLRNRLGLPTPDGFVITSRAFDAFMDHERLGFRISAELQRISPFDLTALSSRCEQMRKLVLDAVLPPDLEKSIRDQAQALITRSGEPLLAMRSSAVGEDSEASFAGQYETVLGVTADRVVEAYKTVLASKYTPKAILYRLRYGLDEQDTPMAVLGLPMVRSRSSGVVYTVDPTDRHAGVMRIDTLWGLGEFLVSGQGDADIFRIGKSPLRILDTRTAHKSERMALSPDGGFAREEVPTGERQARSLSDETALTLGKYGLLLEQYVGRPQDMEWALDQEGRLFILQSRPLDLGIDQGKMEQPEPAKEIKARTLSSKGTTVSQGTASGRVMIISGRIPQEVPEGTIIVARNAAPELAALLDRAEAVITEHGGVASHLASVARELGVPALFDVPGATATLRNGMIVTVETDAARVYEGRVDSLLALRDQRRSHVVDSPMHKRLRRVLDHITPLNLTDPGAESFSPQGCKTVHDIIRFAHEKSMKEMFGLAEHAESRDVHVARMKARIPLVLYCMDLGGGLTENVTTCDEVTPADLRSVPMLALWKGMTHPGIVWTGAVSLSARNVASLMTTGMFTNPVTDDLGGNSYALLSREYLNLSARFGYHFANIDAFCGDETGRNHILLRFAGGAGNIAGKSLRLNFLATVLGRLGFIVEITGEVLEGSFKGADRTQTEFALDQLGRLMASSRLLDLGIASRSEIPSMVDSFFRGDYNFLEKQTENPLPSFSLHEGDWERIVDGELVLVRQDGSRWATSLSIGFANLMGRISGKRYQRFLDNVEAYFHFPVAIVKDLEPGDCSASLKVRLMGGSIDQAGGLAFGGKNIGNYLVLRLDALKDDLTLYEFRDGERVELASTRLEVPAGEWHEVGIELRGGTVTCFCNGKPLLIHHREQPIQGFLGLWTKADSITDFRELVVFEAESAFCIRI